MSDVPSPVEDPVEDLVEDPVADPVEDLVENLVDEEIVAEAERFFRAQLPADWVAAVDADDPDGLGAARRGVDPDELWTRLSSRGHVVPTWPVEYGGLGATRGVGRAIARALGRYKVPRFNNPVGVDLVGPAILRWGSDDQKARYLPRIAAYQDIWCQLFSEPGAGSDLAGLATRAVRDGDTWVIRGQKVWTSLADVASFGILLARTDPDVPKHAGITAFVLPMARAGVTVRPLRQMTGDAEFCEVFLDDARIDDALRLGPVGDGWRVGTSVLMNERTSIAGTGASLPGTVTGRSVTALIQRHAPVTDPALRQRLAQVYIEDRLVSLTNQRAAARRRAGQPPGPEASISKLFFSEHTQRVQALAVDLEGPAAQAWDDGDRWLEKTAWSFLRVRSKTIAGGTSEVQRNILGERVLGLPREPDVDRSLPWSQVRRSG
ncbi:MAG TPA: acyl-CoA dehydrogenase family protein [Acidimicrobiales bacterium]|nr:acyl-CoA dehydrogenase family protein [Acidimicrobiales bacterium]